MNSSRGFTLIEILVVVAIIGVLAAAFLPGILSAQDTANAAAEERNLQFHYDNAMKYQMKRNYYPKGDGPRWIIEPWQVGDVAHTQENFDRYFTPGRPGGDYVHLKEMGPKNIWKKGDPITSMDTDFAGPGPELARGMRRLGEDMPLMSTDNEGPIPTFESGQINVLLGSRAVRRLIIDDYLEYGWTVEEASTRPFPVGPESPHPLLQQLSVH